MIKLQYLFILFFFITDPIVGSNGEHSSIADSANDSTFSKETDETNLDKFLSRKMKKAGLIGMQVAFISNGVYIWQGNYGIKEYGTNNTVDENTLFMIASCSKPVTAFGILKLMDRGKLSLDDPVNQYLPFKVSNPNFPDEVITFRMLLSHVSSLKDNWPVMMPLYTLEEGGDSPIPLGEFLAEYLVEGGRYYDEKENFLKKGPATQFQYCNVGYALLGYLIENISGMPFKSYIQTEIFDPFGMDDAYWFLADIPHTNIAKPHEMPTRKSDFTKPKVLKHFGYPDYPDGQIRTTAADYARFLKVILNEGDVDGNQFVKKETIDEFLKIQYPETFKYQAIAWNYNEFDNWIYYLLMPRLASHTGADPGVATAVSFDPETKSGAIIFTNSPPRKFLDQKTFYQEIMKRLLKEAKRNKSVAGK